MRAAYYTKLGSARDVLQIGEIDTPSPGPGEIRVRVHVSGVNPSDWKARLRGRGAGLPFPTIIPHSDGAGIVDAVGAGVEARRVGQRVWVMNAQWKRPFGTAAEYVVLPQRYVVPLPDGVDLAAAACFGIPLDIIGFKQSSASSAHPMWGTGDDSSPGDCAIHTQSP
jgi:NADPH2:quinone reductase